jgi:hypothetical protein
MCARKIGFVCMNIENTSTKNAPKIRQQKMALFCFFALIFYREKVGQNII